MDASLDLLAVDDAAAAAAVKDASAVMDVVVVAVKNTAVAASGAVDELEWAS